MEHTNTNANVDKNKIKQNRIETIGGERRSVRLTSKFRFSDVKQNCSFISTAKLTEMKIKTGRNTPGLITVLHENFT
jgi:hypothetical protein